MSVDTAKRPLLRTHLHLTVKLAGHTPDKSFLSVNEHALGRKARPTISMPAVLLPKPKGCPLPQAHGEQHLETA